MPAPLFLIANEARVYKMGRVGFDSGASDPGANYTATMRTEKISPDGELGYCQFRQIGFRIYRTGSFTLTVKVYVDGVQTQIYDASSTRVNQVIVITKPAPVLSPEETLIEADIDGKGSYVEVELTVASNNVTGVFLPEELEVHYRPLRQARETVAAESQ
jgi:hypothetical protein